MSEFRYKHGDRPLEGYTIQHAAGRGGFGEVYYAVADSGREVALKVIQGYEQIELRGVSQCMNLKSPHLVTIFDVKHNLDGTPFVIMEFVAGPSLRQIIDESPAGLGTQKAAFFLREIGKGLSYLHECGIVHRDLKPGNIFFENGYVKIGDYGLSKAIGVTTHSQQTVTVGTVHYMAPEVGAGRYDKGIDIYALGAVLFEMLTGQVPYLGASPAEVLMKHMTAQPDVRNIEEPFATVIRKAMAHDPKDRYQNVQEMVEAVFGAEHVRQSVSCFSPESLSMVAARAAAHVHVGGSSTPQPRPAQSPPQDSDFVTRVTGAAERFGDRMAAFGDRMAEKFGKKRERIRERWQRKAARWQRRHGAPLPGTGVMPHPSIDEARDPLPRRQRTLLALMTIALISFSATAIIHPSNAFVLMVPLMSFGAFVGISLACKSGLVARLGQESWLLQRLALGGPAVVLALLFSLPVVLDFANRPDSPVKLQRVPLPNGYWEQAVLHGPSPISLWAPVAAGLLLFNWRKMLSKSRCHRVRLMCVILPCALAATVAGSMDDRGDAAALAAAIVAAAGLAAQIGAAWDPLAATRRNEAIPVGAGGQPAAAAVPPPPSPEYAGPAARPPVPPPLPAAPPPVPPSPATLRPPMSGFERALWIIAIVTSLSGGIGLPLLLILLYRRANSMANASDSQYGAAKQSIISMLLAFVGTIVFLAAMILGLLSAIDLPGFFAAGIPDPRIPADALRAWGGYDRWPELLRMIGWIGTAVLMFISATLFMLGRRGAGTGHMLRALFGLGAFALALYVFADSMPQRWQAVHWNNQVSVAASIDAHIRGIHEHALGSAFIAMFGLLLLVWPHRHSIPAMPSSAQGGTR